MLKNSTLLSIIIFVFVTSSCRTQEVVNEVQPTSSMLADKIIQAVFEKENFPGLGITVWKNGKSVYAKGFGYADIDNQVKIDPQKSLFRIGSVSKPYTAAGLAILYEADKVDLDAPIELYVPSFPQKEHAVSLRQLAGHLGGIRHYKGIEFMSNVHYPTVEEGLSIFIEDDLINEPGTKYSYSSYGWNLISAAMEKAANKDFLSFMEDEVFEVLGMDNTHADDNTRPIAEKVKFYTQDRENQNQLAPTVDNSYKWAGGGFLSTVEDMAIFGQAHLDALYLDKATIDLWTTSQTTKDGKSTNYGIGWRSGEDKKGRPWFGHTGGSVGGSSILVIYPEHNMVVAMAINLSSARYRDLAFRVAEQFMD